VQSIPGILTILAGSLIAAGTAPAARSESAAELASWVGVSEEAMNWRYYNIAFAAESREIAGYE
jgi:hypothetical protein